MNIDPKLLCEILSYDPSEGTFQWVERLPHHFNSCKYSAERECARWNKRYAGKTAFTAIDSKGYPQGHIFGVKYLAHRVAWAVHSGAWPKAEIDHINGIKTDFRISNLREVTHAENMKNLGFNPLNKSGVSGVHWHSQSGKWRAKIGPDFLGQFANFHDAVNARMDAEIDRGFRRQAGDMVQ